MNLDFVVGVALGFALSLSAFAAYCAGWNDARKIRGKR
jgi:hypothetical protein